ncbi:uracil-DNA glycosylase [Oceaniglobus ichthyenteri]|uniref:uracil-DNA glycosylase n=1 Tax=Oceaniglobus ichthyenteri TaxID=2136177 RepID=UPI000D3919FC|nr:uracil-DNA glycosylase [Oceaniglobus ichthyenteri]
MESRLDQMDFDTLTALLAWQVELGADEPIGDLPVDRYELPDAAVPMAAVAPPPKPGPAKAGARPPLPPPMEKADPVALAHTALSGVRDLAGLRAAMAGFEGCELKRGARNTVFADGLAGARVMVIGEAPGREEDSVGKPFVGRAGQLLDRMFAAIGLGRENTGADGLYITNIMPWRPPENRDPNPEEIATMMPFVQRHVELAAPEVLVLMGNISCYALLGRKGVTRLRGQWAEALNLPVLPMFHPAYLLRNPGAKRDAWHDLLMLQARLRGGGR